MASPSSGQSEFVDNANACCGVSGCSGPIHNGGLCKTHYERASAILRL